MENFASTIIQTYGIFGVIILLIGGGIYFIWKDHRNNWGAKIDSLKGELKGDMKTIQGSMDNVDRKVDLINEKLTHRMDKIEHKIDVDSNSYQEHIKVTKEQTTGMMLKGMGGEMSSALKKACHEADCDHIFLGSFHNGTADLRGIHYCKFDIMIDEFRDPLHLRKTDIEFRPLYKDENILAYGDLPYAVVHAGKYKFNIENKELLELSDTLYRRCIGREVKQLALCVLYDKEGLPMGFIGAVSYIKREIDVKTLELCAREIENIYNL